MNTNFTFENPKHIKKVVLGKNSVSLEEFIAVTRYKAKLYFSEDYVSQINHSRLLMDKFITENRLIYGVTTGFGDNVRTVISSNDAETLQVNILRSHAVSVGKPLVEEVVRGIQLMMLVNIGQGYSGVSFEVVNLIRNMLNKQLTPFAPGEGSVGYLSVEAQISLVLIGEGKAWYEGKLLSGDQALRKAGLQPINLKCKEGLALLNGSTSVTAMAILALYNAIIITKTADIAGALAYESLKGTVLGLDSRLLKVKHHHEQLETANNLLRMLRNSEIMKMSKNARVQDPYAIRCLPHIHGAVKRTLKEAWESVYEEMNSCTDNPIIFPEKNDGIALMGGNFDGSYVGIHMDSACIAMGTLAKLSERLTDRLVNRHLNDFPPFLARNPGLNNGFMIPQYTAAALVGEIKILSHPSSVDNVPTCANQEDPVSFAYFASKKAYAISSKLEYILSIQVMVSVEAMSFIKDLKPSSVVQKVIAFVRERFPYVENDRHFYQDIENIRHMIQEREIVDIVEGEIGYLDF